MVKSLSVKNKDNTPKKSLNLPKDGFVHKKKNQKFKETPTGRVPLINGSKTQKESNMKEQNVQKQKNTLLQKSLEQKKKGHQKAGNKQQESPKKELDKNNSLQSEKDDTDSEEDINEGIVLGEQTLMEESDDSNSEEESDDDSSEKEPALPILLGTSLADETDEDDEDYEEQLEENEKKGVKMFKGLKPNDSINSTKGSSDKSATDDANTDESDEEDEDEEEEDDDDEEEESEDEVAEGSALGLKALLGNSIADDDDDDEDFVEPGENDEDDTASEEDEEEEDEEEEENNTVKNSKKNKNKEDKDSSIEELKNDEKTIFVGNLPKDVTKKQLIKLFKKFGKIESIRLRGMVPKTLNVPKKVAAKTNELHPKIKSIYAYVKFASEESAKEAMSMNGTKFEGNYLTVNSANKSENKHPPKKSVFVGNLHFHISQDTVRQHFEQCGEIESVRIIKDNRTGVGKGFGYVNFKTEDAVALALELDGTTLSMRQIRVKPHAEQHKKNKEKHRKRSLSAEHSDSSPKRAKSSAVESVSIRNKKNAMRRKITKEKSKSPQKETEFQGQKADASKKLKKSKLDKKKEILAKKLTAKPKKPSN
ncbi:uncharacterized protein LOC143427859 isoform X2 [Xylocopa sonorina]|uniref:uncharacterized protein LOC143427859 isoform X2 n=1 Tax=Xylocopa sonorina TaxID=1818115 RepID=UPI00403B07D9